jgi:hypothetical protein
MDVHHTDHHPDDEDLDQTRTELAALIAAMPDEAVETLLRLVRVWFNLHPHQRRE